MPTKTVTVKIPFSRGSTSRYSDPWIGEITAWEGSNKAPDLRFGGYMSDSEHLEIECQFETVLYYGQKDNRNTFNSERKFCIVMKDAAYPGFSLLSLTRSEAYQIIKARREKEQRRLRRENKKMPRMKIELTQDELNEAIRNYIKERTGQDVEKITIKVHPGQAEMTPTTYSVEAE
jgi:hypothetical protein